MRQRRFLPILCVLHALIGGSAVAAHLILFRDESFDNRAAMAAKVLAVLVFVATWPLLLAAVAGSGVAAGEKTAKWHIVSILYVCASGAVVMALISFLAYHSIA